MKFRMMLFVVFVLLLACGGPSTLGGEPTVVPVVPQAPAPEPINLEELVNQAGVSMIQPGSVYLQSIMTATCPDSSGETIMRVLQPDLVMFPTNLGGQVILRESYGYPMVGIACESNGITKPGSFIYSDDGSTQETAVGGTSLLVLIACEIQNQKLNTYVVGVVGVAFPPGQGPAYFRDDSGGSLTTQAVCTGNQNWLNQYSAEAEAPALASIR